MQITDKEDYIEFYPGPVKSCPKEDDEQIFCSDWVRYNYPEIVYWHTVNEGKKSMCAARRDAAKGLLKGVSDCLFLIPESLRGSYQFGAIELKRAGKTQASPVSEDQKAFLKSVREAGGFAAVAYGRGGFLAAFKEMISNSTNC